MRNRYVVIDGVVYPQAFHKFGWLLLQCAVGASEVRCVR